MRFESPLWFVAAGIVVLGAVAHLLYRQTGMVVRPSILFSNLPPLLRQGPTWRVWARKGLFFFRIATLLLLVVALARPQKGKADSVILSEGIDIIMLIDTSGSMAAEDFGDRKTRIYHATEVMKEFAARREADRIGLISFGAHAYTRCPMTLDHGLLEGFFDHVYKEWMRAYESSARKRASQRNPRMTPQEQDLEGTAIGDAIVTAVGRLEDSTATSRIIVLLTDGSQTAGDSAPEAAAELAAQFGVKIYCVGAGSNRTVPVTVFDRFGNERRASQRFPLDEETLKAIAKETGGQYFKAENRERLSEVYAQIDELERTELNTRDYREWYERFQAFAWLALAFLLIDALLTTTILRAIP